MKKLLLPVLALFFATSIFSQDSLHYTIKADALYNPDVRILYKGIDNPLTITTEGVNEDSLLIYMTAGTFEGGEGQYSVFFEQDSANPLREAYVYFATIDTIGDTILLDSVKFALEFIPEPIAMVAGSFGGKIKKEVLLAADSITIILKGCHLKPIYRVLSFIMTYYKSILVYDYPQAHGPRMTEQHKGIISRFDLGARFRFREIRVVGPRGVVKVLEPLIFEISL